MAKKSTKPVRLGGFTVGDVVGLYSEVNNVDCTIFGQIVRIEVDPKDKQDGFIYWCEFSDIGREHAQKVSEISVDPKHPYSFARVDIRAVPSYLKHFVAMPGAQATLRLCVTQPNVVFRDFVPGSYICSATYSMGGSLRKSYGIVLCLAQYEDVPDDGVIIWQRLWSRGVDIIQTRMSDIPDSDKPSSWHFYVVAKDQVPEHYLK